MTSSAELETFSLADPVRRAQRLLAHGDTSGALALLEPLTSDDEVYLPARLLLAMAAWKMGQLDWALSLARQCHEIWPMDGTVAEVLASLYAQAGNLRESLFMGKLATALGGFGELRELIPPEFPIFDAAFYTIKDRPKLTAAKSRLSEGDLIGAIEQARQHAALNPQDGHAHAFHASTLLAAGHAAYAVDVLAAVEAYTELPPYCANLYARALTAVGEFDKARQWYARAIEVAPDDPAIAAARVADGLLLGDKPALLAKSAADWAERFCPAAPNREWRRPEGKLVIGYLVPDSVDQLDLRAVAAAARAHDRERVTVIGYGCGPQSWEANTSFRGAFETWQDIRALDPATLVRFFERDGLHVVIDAAGFGAPNILKALSQLRTAIRVTWLGNSTGFGKPVYDAQIVGQSVKLSGRASWRFGPAYPILRPVSIEQRETPDRNIRFGADARMAQLDDTTVRLWSSVLEAVPDAKLLLRARDMAPGRNIERLIERFGRKLAAQIDIIADETTENFYSHVDVALTPHRAGSPRLAAEAVAHDVPAVAMTGTGLSAPDAVLLRDLGLGAMLVAADGAEYVDIAVNLARSEETREKSVAALRKVVPSADESARRFAATLEKHALEALEAV